MAKIVKKQAVESPPDSHDTVAWKKLKFKRNFDNFNKIFCPESIFNFHAFWIACIEVLKLNFNIFTVKFAFFQN